MIAIRTHRTSAAALAAAVALAAAALAGSHALMSPDSASATPSKSLVYDAKLIASESVTNDTGAKGFSPGDTSVDVASLTANGKPAGRVHLVSTIIDANREGIQQDMTLFLPGGTIFATGGGTNKPIAGGAPQSTQLAAVTGGTGSYVGATGTLEIVDVSATKARLTIHLR